MAGDTLTGADQTILALFEAAGTVATPTPGVRAWLARDPDSARPVLIKRIGANGTGAARATEALTLLHAGVVRTRRWIGTNNDGDNAIYVVRDVVRGKNLRQFLAQSAQQNAQALQRALAPLIAVLEYAHREGVAHGGVSAENILIGDDAQSYLSDWATADPKAPQHFLVYSGSATPLHDIRALGRVVTQFLPGGGAFVSPVVRGRIENIVARCDTLGDLRDTLAALDKFAVAPDAPSAPPTGSGPRASLGTAPSRQPEPVLRPLPHERLATAARRVGNVNLSQYDMDDDPTPARAPVNEAEEPWRKRPGPPLLGEDVPAKPGVPRLTAILAEKTSRIAQGGGGAATLVVRNDGDAPLLIRMIATQHAWLNVRPLELPLIIAPGRDEKITFVISAARLSPGDYRSEVWLSANANGAQAENLPGDWYKHTAEIRITVEGAAAPRVR